MQSMNLNIKPLGGRHEFTTKGIEKAITTFKQRSRFQDETDFITCIKYTYSQGLEWFNVKYLKGMETKVYSVMLLDKRYWHIV